MTYTGDGATSRDISHNLKTAPGVIIIKRIDAASDWTFQHVYNNNYVQYLNITAARSDSGATFQFNSTNFKVVGPSSGLASTKCTNVSGASYVAYLFAHDAQDFGTDEDESIIKCGSYTGNGSDIDVDLGFEPQWLMVKSATGNENWLMVDNMRGLPTGGNISLLRANTVDQEIEDSPRADFTSTGFKITSTNSDWGQNGATYIYMAIRRPHKPASEFAATDLFTVVNGDGTGAPSFKGVLTDFKINTTPASSQDFFIGSRLQGSKTLRTNDSSAEGNSSSSTYDFMNGWSGSTGLGSTWISWMWRRAPGYFDVVTYTGTGSATTIAHNLGVKPEMMWFKARDQAYSWMVYHEDLTADRYLRLNQTNDRKISDEAFNNTEPTAEVFTVSYDNAINNNNYPYIAHLFASVDGISKVGSYTGTGNDLNVDCGFSAGSRFILIKRTDITADWYFWDSLRGIVAGNDPYLLLNHAAAQVTNTDYVDPLSSGFTVTSSAPTALNASGGTYIFLAIA